MKKLLCLMAIIFIVPAVACSAQAGYLIGPSDQLEISVWGEEGLSRSVSVRSDGFISLPLIGDIAASGKTPPQLQKDIEASLTKYVKDPRCAVIVLEPRSKRFYIEGQINSPGQFLLDSALTFTQAISMAGGFTEWADKSSIIILRTEDGKAVRIEVNFKKIIQGKMADIPIRPGDTIIVP